MKKAGKESRYCFDACTVADMIHDTMPSWNSLDDWFMWPPDVFLITSLIFKRTGCYRYVVNEKGWQFEGQKWSQNGWQNDLDKDAREWMEQINESLIKSKGIKYTPFIRTLIDDMVSLIDEVTMQDLKVLEKPHAKLLCQKIIMAHALADEACAGIGLINNLPSKSALAHYLALPTLSVFPNLFGQN